MTGATMKNNIFEQQDAFFVTSCGYEDFTEVG